MQKFSAKKIEEQAINHIHENALVGKGEKILVAFSGGADSVFLLHFLNKFKRKYRIEIFAAHLNHLLRGKEAYSDEQFCKKICKQFSIPLFVERKRTNSFARKNKFSLEEAGRILRYDFFERLRRKHNFDKIATAHNINDNAETVLLNLFKGAGMNGASGIPVRRENIIRPLLTLEKDDILKYLAYNKIEFVEDQSNKELKYQRNIIRHEILPVIRQKINPRVHNSIYNFSQLIREVNRMLNDEIFTAKALEAGKLSNGNFTFNYQKFNAKHHFLFSEAIRYSYKHHLKKDLAQEETSKLFRLIKNQTGKTIFLKGGYKVTKNRDELVFALAPDANNRPIIIPINGTIALEGRTISVSEYNQNKIPVSVNRTKEFISGDAINGEFTIRRWQKGDKFIPFGHSSPKKISDFLTNIKFPAHLKKDQFVLVHKDKVIWLIGIRIDNSFKITPETKRIIQLTVTEN